MIGIFEAIVDFFNIIISIIEFIFSALGILFYLIFYTFRALFELVTLLPAPLTVCGTALIVTCVVYKILGRENQS